MISQFTFGPENWFVHSTVRLSSVGSFSIALIAEQFCFGIDSLLRLFQLQSADDTNWIILLAKMPFDGCLHHPKRVRFVFRGIFFPHLNLEFCQNFVQSLRAESLSLVVNISRFTPFHPYCQPYLRGLLCVFASSQLVYLFYFFAQHNWKTGLF